MIDGFAFLILIAPLVILPALVFIAYWYSEEAGVRRLISGLCRHLLPSIKETIVWPWKIPLPIRYEAALGTYLVTFSSAVLSTLAKDAIKGDWGTGTPFWKTVLIGLLASWIIAITIKALKKTSEEDVVVNEKYMMRMYLAKEYSTFIAACRSKSIHHNTIRKYKLPVANPWFIKHKITAKDFADARRVFVALLVVSN